VVETNLRESRAGKPGPDVREEMERLWAGAKAKEKADAALISAQTPFTQFQQDESL
jgi:hypothetical protein